MSLLTQIAWLFILALAAACISWTVTQEEVFKEPRKYCVSKSKDAKTLLTRKFFYLFTCEYCFSHYVTLFLIILTDFRLLIDDWRGYIIAGFATIWVANFYMSCYRLLRLNIKTKKNTTNNHKKQSKEFGRE